MATGGWTSVNCIPVRGLDHVKASERELALDGLHEKSVGSELETDRQHGTCRKNQAYVQP